MKIKRYKGKRIDEVMRRIKAELGDDAVILSTKKSGDGVEVLVAVDFSIDEAPRERIEMVEVVKREDAVVPSPSPSDEVESLRVEVEELKKLLVAQKERYDELKDLRRELTLIRRALETSHVGMVNVPIEALPLYNRLQEMEVDPKVISFVMKRISEEELLSPVSVCEEVLVQTLRVSSFEPREGVPVVFSGPTGVGKTTTLAKIASILKFYEGRDTSIVSIDTFRVGAVDQLKIYADILEIDFYPVNSPEEFAKVVEVLENSVILVDTAGRSPKDSVRMEEINSFLKVLNDYMLLVVIPYGYRLKEALNVVEAFSTKRPDGIILTKLDETEVYGLPVNLSWHIDIPIIFVTNGQRVPEDIERADPKRMVKYLLGEEVQ